MNTIEEDVIKKLRSCDDFHNRCDCLLEHGEITYLLEYIDRLKLLLEDSYKSAHPIDSASRIFFEKDKEIERLKNGLHKLLQLNNYMIHCSSKRVIDRLILKQWYLIYEVLGERSPGIAFASKGEMR